jgi:hypothetical protein
LRELNQLKANRADAAKLIINIDYEFITPLSKKARIMAHAPIEELNLENQLSRGHSCDYQE